MNSSDIDALIRSRGIWVSRASTATVQTSTSQLIVSGILVDQPRIGNGGYGQGLVIEESRSNILLEARNTRGNGWTAGILPRTTGRTSADGSPGATRFTRAAGLTHFSDYCIAGFVSGTAYATTFWAKSSTTRPVTPSTATKAYTSSDEFILDPTYRRLVITSTFDGGAGSFLQPQNGNPSSGDGSTDVDVDFFQLEAGKFPTEVIVSAGSSATRAGEALNIDPGKILVNGEMSLEMEFIPKFGTGDTSTFHMLYVIGDHYAYINTSVGGYVNNTSGIATSAPMHFAAGDIVQFWVQLGGSRYIPTLMYRKNFGPAILLGQAAGPINAPLVAGSYNTILTNNTSMQASCWVRKIRAYLPGNRPGWTR